MHVLIPAMIIGLIPAYIASQKGRSFILWWFFGAMLFIVALPVSIIIKPDEHLIALKKGLIQCPHCAEWVRKDARVCRYCNRELDRPPIDI